MKAEQPSTLNPAEAAYNRYQVPEPGLLHRVYDSLVYHSGNFPHKRTNRFIHGLCKRFHLWNKNILDIGCYTGYYSFFFRAEGNRVTGIDISNKVEYAKNRFGKFGIDFIKGEARELSSQFKPEQFDFIFCSNFPGHYDTGNLATSGYMKKLVAAAFPLLKKEGIFYYAFYSTLHEKVTHPVTAVDAENFLKTLDKKPLEINTIAPIDEPCTEFVCIR